MDETNRIDPDDVRRIMRRWATGVTVVTSHFNGYRHGLTVSSFTSISLTPPLLLVSIQRKARTHSLVKSSGVFGITILSEDQADISDRFAGRLGEEADRFEGLETFTLHSGSPFLVGGLAFLDCQVVRAIPISGHTLFIGQILAMRLAPEGRPLIYFNRKYRFLRDG